MKRLLAIAAAAALAGMTAPTAGARPLPEVPPVHCDPGSCTERVERAIDPIIEEVVWAVRCIGDSLGGNACHG